MEPIVAPLAIAGMIVSALLSIGVPLALAIVWNRRTKASWSALLVGCATFVLFVYVLESSLHALCLGLAGENVLSAFLNATPWAYVLYGGLAAGIFEETGRFVAFQWLLRKQTRRQTSVMYGIGHGGIEAVLVCGIGMISTLLFSLSLNASGTEAMLAQAGGQLAAMQSSIDTVKSTPAGMYFVSGVERMIAIAFHISLSVLVFAAVRRKDRFYLYPVAVLLHAAVDYFAVLYQIGVIKSILLVEVVVAAMTALTAFYAWRVYREELAADAQLNTPEEAAARANPANESNA